MITKDRIRELIKEHDEHPNPKLGGLNYYSTMMSIVFENEGITGSYSEWDSYYTKEKQHEAIQRASCLIEEVLREDGKLEKGVQ